MSDFDSLFQQAWAASKAGRDLEARLLLAAGVTTLAPKDARAVVVGGTAVDFWAADTTGGTLEPSHMIRASQDIDLVVAGFYGDDKKLRLALMESGEFQPSTDGIPPELVRSWLGIRFPVMVEVLGNDLAGDPDRVATLEIGDGIAYLWGVEDTAWQYAEIAVSQRSRTDWTRALAIAAAQQLDWEYFGQLAEEGRMPFIAESLRAGDSYDELHARS